MTSRRMIVLLLALVLLGDINLAVGATNPQRWALLIGISDYPRFRNKLSFAAGDAQYFFDFIQTPEGFAFPPANIKILLNEQATRKNIHQAIKWLGSHVGPADLLYVFFSGHGELDDQDRAYLMPYDSDEENPDDMGYRLDEFMQRLKDRTDPRQMVVFVDACHAQRR